MVVCAEVNVWVCEYAEVSVWVCVEVSVWGECVEVSVWV